jgi:hypothetical protein
MKEHKMASHLKSFEKKHLKQGEIIKEFGDGYIGEMMGKGDKKQHNGILIVTDSRVIFYRSGIFGEVLETMPLKNITSIERKSFAGHRTVVIHTSNDELAFKSFDQKKEKELFDAIEAGRHQDLQTQTPSNQNPDATETLRKLAELKAAGIITAAEFETKKTDILARM